MKKLVLSTALVISMLAVTACSSQSADTKPAQQNEAAATKEAPKEAPKAESKEKAVSDKLELKKVLSDKVEILIPKGFEIMSEEMAKLKYPLENRPTLIYTNKDGSINVAFNHTPTPIQESQLPELKNQVKQMFKTVHPAATWYKDEMTEINGKKVGVFEFLTPAANQKDMKVYNLIFISELDGKFLLTTFNCTEKQMADWKPLAQEILQSFKTN